MYRPVNLSYDGNDRCSEGEQLKITIVAKKNLG